VTLERATALAFAGHLRDAQRALATTDAPSEQIAWVRAYLETARGRFAHAEARCRALLDGTSSRSLRSRAGITLGSVLRQTARHEGAAGIDAEALRAAPSRPLQAHALIGLAADAVGLFDARRCGRRLAQASRIAPARDWRCGVRLDWVRAERAMLVGEIAEAIRSSRAALGRSRRVAALRHEAKSLLFLGAALREAGDVTAVAHLEEARRIARRLGASPIVDVAQHLLETTRR
jgi:tetratricopeptide (TPR) repeat protein